MSSRGRRPDPRAGFRRPQQEDQKGVHQALLKNARKSGQLNLSGRGLSEVPQEVWRINIDVPEESKTVSLDNEDRWWEQEDLQKLILASNQLTALSEDIKLLPALSLLDVHDNHLTSLPESLSELRNIRKLVLNHNQFASFPESIQYLTELAVLHFAHNKLSEVGYTIGQLVLLQELDLSHNQLTSLPTTIGYLTRVTKLNLANNQLKELPEELSCMDHLTMLDLTHNQLTKLPKDIGQLKALEQLYLRHNRLTELPTLTDCNSLKELHVGNNAVKEINVKHLENVQMVSVLDLRDNKISILPDEITLLQNLERLDLTNNDISNLPYALGTLNKLKSLVLDGNPMKSIRRDILMRGTNELKRYLRSRMDEEVDSGVKVNTTGAQGRSGIIGEKADVDEFTVKTSKCLDFSGKNSTEIPEEVWAAVGEAEMTVVNLSKNKLEFWPERLTKMPSIRELNLGVNKFTVIPPDVGSLTNLMMIDLRNNMLQTLPKDVAGLKHLREIIISGNRFDEIPACLYGLSKLEILLAANNKIQAIDPEAIKTLPALATLDLQNNDIGQVPPELGNCTQIKSLQLEGNRFRNPRPAILAKGTNALLEYLRDRIAS